MTSTEHRQRLQLHDAADLAHTATLTYPGDPLGALGWVAFVWSRSPDTWEKEVRRFAVELLRDDLSDADRATWDRVVAHRETLTITPMGALVDAVQARHERQDDETHIGAVDAETMERVRMAA